MLIAQDPTALSDPLALQDSLVVILGVLGTVGLILGCIFTVLRILQHIRRGDISITPNPLNVSTTEPLATRHDLEACVARIDASLTEERNVAREALLRVHGRIDAIAHNGAELSGKMSHISTQVAQLFDLVTANGKAPRSRP